MTTQRMGFADDGDQDDYAHDDYADHDYADDARSGSSGRAIPRPPGGIWRATDQEPMHKRRRCGTDAEPRQQRHNPGWTSTEQTDRMTRMTETEIQEYPQADEGIGAGQYLNEGILGRDHTQRLENVFDSNIFSKEDSTETDLDSERYPRARVSKQTLCSLSTVSKIVKKRSQIPVFLNYLEKLAEQSNGFHDNDSREYWFKLYKMLLMENFIEDTAAEAENDKGGAANFSRVVKALFSITMGTTEQISDQLRRAIVHGDESAASGGFKEPYVPESSVSPNLNESQRTAIQAGSLRTLTLILGPPGTGKTQVGLQLLVAWTKKDQLRGHLVSALATSSNNSAVDHLFTGLIKQGAQAARFCSIKASQEVDPKYMRNIVPEQTSSKVSKLRESEVTCSTAVFVCRLNQVSMTFPSILVDEAGQITELDNLVPLTMGACRVALIGDPNQLPPQVRQNEAVVSGMDQSLFLRLKYSGGIPVFMLNEQYRMHPKIAHFPAKFIYDCKLCNGSCVDEFRPPNGLPWRKNHPVMFVDCTGSELQQDNSFVNHREAFLIQQMANALFDKGDVRPEQVGVMATYRCQADLIKSAFEYNDDKRWKADLVKIGTVDSFQGLEYDVIFVSLVRSTKLGFAVLCIMMTSG